MAGFFGFFDYSKPGPGVSKDAPKKRGFFRYFDVLGRKFWNLSKLNFLYSICTIPMFILGWFLSYYLINDLSQLLGEIEQEQFLALDMFLRGGVGILILTLFGAGPATCGFSYVLRNYSREEHAWVFSDFFEHFRKNFKQAALVVLIDSLALVVCAINYTYYTTVASGYLRTIMATVFFMVFVVFVLMHFYIYPMMVTFKLSIGQIYRNSLLFALMKLPQNLLLLIINLALTLGLMAGYMYMPLALVLVPLLFYSVVWLINMFYVDGVMKKVMIGEKEQEEEPSEIFTDIG